MFEKILEKILIQYFGRFITGLDKNNLKLGVWSGNVAIENVNLKSELIELLELPIKLKQSSVGKMTIKIPWKKLSSQPLEITLENVFLTVNPLPQNQWQFGDEIIVLKKFQALQEYCKTCMKRGLKKKKQKSDEEKDKGYLDKMAIKIMDNIQVKIVNIHFRYEGSYCFGLTLECLEISTTDENWKKSFVDRTEQKNQMLSMNKVFQLQNLALYWNTITEECNQDYMKFMEQRILRNNQEAKQYSQFIISISAEMQVIQNSPTLLDQPLNNLSLTLDQLNLLVQRDQFQQIVHLFDQFSMYSKLLWVQRKKVLDQDRSQFLEHQRNFAVLYPKIQMSDTKSMEVLDEQEQLLFKASIRSIDYTTLLDWVQYTARQLIKEAKLTQATSKKIKSETAWWKSDKKQAQDVFLNEEELIAINEQIDKIFEEERKKVATRPDTSTKYKFIFFLRGGVFRINNQGDGMQLVFSEMSSIFETKQNESFDLLFKLQSLNLDLLNQEQIQKFCYKQQNNLQIEQFLKIHFTRNADSAQEDASVMIQIDPIECQYDSLFIRRWQDFFNIEDLVDNIVQESAKESISSKQMNLEEIMNTNLKLNIFVQIASPTILMGNWIINLGHLQIQSEQDSKQYDYYTLKLNDLSISSDGLAVLSQLQVEFQMERLKVPNVNKPKMIISGIIPPINFNLNDQLQTQLLNIDKLIFPQRSSKEKLEKLQKQKDLIIKSSVASGQIQKKDQYIWNKCFGVLSGNYIYFFKKEHDLRWEDRLCLRNMKYHESNNTVILENENQTCNLILEENMKSQIKQLIDERKNVELLPKTQQILQDVSILQLSLKLEAFNIQLLRQDRILYEIKIEDLLYKSNKRTLSLEYSVIVGDLSIIDFVYDFQNEDSQYLIRKQQMGQDAFLAFESKTELNYSMTKVNIGEIEMNWKPDTFLRLSDIARIGTEMLGIEAIQLEDDETEQLIRGDTAQQIQQQKLEKLMNDHKEREYKSETYEFARELLNYEQLIKNFNKVSHLFVNISTYIVQQLEVNVSKAKVNLFHRQSHINLGYIYFENLCHRVQFTQIGKFMIGNISLVQLHDTTNYPNTLEQYSPQLILDASQGVEYYYSFYNLDYLKNSQELITSFSQITINKAIILYQHQQLMRYMNYIFLQIIQMIANPQLLVINDNRAEPRLVCGTIEYLFNSFMNPQFMFQEYVIKEAIINMKQFYQKQDCLSIQAKNIVFQNDQAINLSRFISSEDQFAKKLPIWNDQFYLLIQDIIILINDQSISNKVNYTLLWDRLIFQHEIQELFKINLRNNYELYSSMNNLDIQLSHQQFQIMMGILMHNLTYDDGKDNLFIHDHHIVKNFTPTEIRYMLQYKYIQIALTKNNQGLMLIQLYDAQIESFIAQNLEKTTNIFAKTIKLSSLSYNLNKELEASVILGTIEPKFIYQQIQKEYCKIYMGQIECQCQQNCLPKVEKQYIQPFKYLTKTSLREGNRPMIEGYQFKLDFAIHKSKELIIDFQENPIWAEIKLLMDFLKYIDLDESLFPKSNEIPKKFALIINIRNGLIVFPSLKDQIVARGSVSYVLEKHVNYFSQKVTIQNIEFFVCQLEQLQNLQFNEVEKRHIILPTNAYLGICEQKNNDGHPVSQTDLSIDKIMLQVCYQDIETVIGVLRYQQKQFQNNIEVLEQQLVEPDSMQQLWNAQIYQIQLIIISVDKSPVPLFEISMKDAQLTFTKIVQYILNIQSQVSISFFNVNLGVWEPFLEPILVLTDHSYNQNGNPKTFTSLQINQYDSDIPLNLNICLSSIKAIKEIQTQLKKSIDNINKKEQVQLIKQQQLQYRKSYIQNNLQTEKIQAVSPYIVDNQTGFDLELTIINKTKKTAEQMHVPKFEQYGMKYQENYFSSQIERRQISIHMLDKNILFKEIIQLDFKKYNNEIRQIEYKLGMLTKQTNVLIQLESQDTCKIMKVSSNILFINKTLYPLELQIIHRLAEISYNLSIQPEQEQYLPVGYEQSLIQLRFINQNTPWTQLIDLQKLITSTANYDLYQQSPYLVLGVNKELIPTLPKKLIFYPPFALINMLLCDIDIHLQFGVPLRLVSKQCQKVMENSLIKGFRFNVKLPAFQLSSPIEISNTLNKPIPFIIRDYQGLEMWLQLIPGGQREGFVTYFIDGGMTIQNSLGIQVYMYGRKKNKNDKEQQKTFARKQLHDDMEYIAGQPIFQITEKEDEQRQGGFLQIIPEVDYLQFSFEQGCLGQKKGIFSQQFATFNASGQYLMQIPKEEGFMEVIGQIQTVDIMDKFQERVIILNPRQVIINRMPGNIHLIQEKYNKSIMLMPEAQFPFYWFSANGQQFLKFRINDLHTGCISLDMQGSLTLPMRDDSGQLHGYMNITAKEEDKTKFIIIEQLHKLEKPLYRIKNRMDYDIQFYQTEIQELNEKIKSKLNRNQEIDYALDNPGFKRYVTLEFYKNGEFCDFVKIELATAEKSTQQTMVDDSVFYITSKFSLQDRQIEVILSSEPLEIEKLQYDSVQAQLSFQIPRLNISLISSKPRSELVLLSMKNIEFIKLDDIIQTIQLKIEDLQIDNNQYMRCTYPVLLTQKLIQSHIPVLSLVIKRAHQIEFINYFQTVQISLQPLALKLTEGTLEELQDIFGELKILKKKKKLAPLNQWQKQIDKSQQLCFFENIQLFPLKIILSFQKTEQKNNQYLKSAATQIVNCDEAQITLKGFGIFDCFTTLDQLKIKVTNNYKDALTANLFKLIGSIDLLGNPMGLLRDVGGGFYDLFEMPYDGFVQGPLEGGLGIAKGVGSLTKGIVSGTFNTVQKITGSVASGISQLSMDDQYLRERQIQNSKKAKNVVHGLGQGMVSLFQGVGLGIAGLVTQPYEGAESGGVEGFFKGVSKGFVGLVVKPVVGVIDLASKTAEGVKNTANYFDDKPNELRIRIPRVFYGVEQQFKNYQLQDAEILYILDKYIPKLCMLDCFVYQIGKYKFAYIISQNFLILLEVIKKNIVLQIQNEEIKGFENLPNEFRIYLFNSKMMVCKKDRLLKGAIEIRKDMISAKQDGQVHKFLEQKLTYVQQMIHDY